MDKLIVIPLIVILSPVMLVVAIIVYFDQGRILFVQQRPGLLKIPFDLYKFRTMYDGDEGENRKSRVGNFLRSYSLDELPQLFNVLKGDMSLAGPRPFLMEYLEYYSDDHARRHWVMPGLTGWAQVNGGNLLSWQDKLDLDVYYYTHMSFWLDLRIYIKTIVLLFSGKKEDTPVEKFSGYDGIN